MKYRVEGGIAHIGTDMVLKISKQQAEARSHALEAVEGGWRPRQVVQFKAGEEIEIVGVNPDKLPRPLAMVLVPAGAKETFARIRAARKSAPKKKAAAKKGASS